MKANDTDTQLQALLGKIVTASQQVARRCDGTETRESQKKLIGIAVGAVRSKVLSAGQQSHCVLYGNQRADRSFEFEHDRLWNSALQLYLRDHLEHMTPEAQEFYDQVRHAGANLNLESALASQVEYITLPLLEGYDAAEEDLNLYVRRLMTDSDDAAANKLIAQEGRTPPQTSWAFFAMFGFLHKAKIAASNGDWALAYSFLLDTSNLIGLHEGTHYVMGRLDKVGDIRRAKINGEKGRADKRKSQERAYKLFWSLRSKSAKGIAEGKDGYLEWKSGAAAAKAISDSIIDAGGDPGLSHRKLTELCREWRELELKSLEPRLIMQWSFPNGAVLKLPTDQ